LLSVLAIAGAGWYAFAQLGAGGLASSEVPDVVGLPRAEALAVLGSTWDLEEKFDRVVDVPAGQVIRTDPPAQTSLEEGQPLSYWVSLGLPLIRVPEADLVGRRVQQAIATIEAVQLTVGEIDEVNSEEIGAGLVMSVEADALELPQGGPVNLVVSLGPPLRVIPEVGPGTDTQQYIANLVDAGLGVNQSEAFDDDVPLGQFVSIDPPPGSSVARGGQVEVVISAGPVPVPVPETSGLDLGDALDRLDAVGLLAGDLLGSGNARCSVVGTDPPAGTDLQPGDAVSIFLSDCGEGQ
jgi:serine/threonine-protein kinase